MPDKVQLIKQEIERRIENLSYLIPDVSNIGKLTRDDIFYFAKSEALKSILQFIDSLPEEPVSEDLDEEIEKIWTNCATWVPSMSGESSLLEESGHYELNLFKSDLKDIARHFAEWQKQQMMKNTVLETKVMMDCDGDGIETPYKEWLTLENTEIPSLPDNIGLKDGDKVKIIIVKED